jgi:hypothetical protein
MKNNKTAINLRLEANIIKALNHLRNNYSYTDPKRFNAEAIFKEVKLSRVFGTIIKTLGIIEYPMPAHVVLTNKIDIITPREIHLALNEYQYASQRRCAKKKQKIKAQELAKIQSKLRFENKQKLRGSNTKISNDALMEALRNAPSLPTNDLINLMGGGFNKKNNDNGYQEALRNAVPPPPQAQNLFNVQGAYYPPTNQDFSVKQLLDGIDAVLPRGFKLGDMLKTLKAAMREEIKDELRREIIADLVNKS